MYKVFINRCELFVGTMQEMEATGVHPAYTIACTGPDHVLEAIRRCRSGARPDAVHLAGEQSQQLLKTFHSVFEQIDAAGGRVQDARGRLLMIHRNGKWDMPKGKLESGESPEQAAIREVCEETGVCDLRIRSGPVVTWHAYPHAGKGLYGEVLKKTCWYGMTCLSFSGFQVQAEEGIDEAGWFTSEEQQLLLKNTYPLIRELVDSKQLSVISEE